MAMRSVRLAVGVLSLLAAPLAANAASITYDFTGAVFSATGSLSSLNSDLIAGTLTFNLDNANPALSSGDIGTYPFPSSWTRAEHSGSAFQQAPSSNYVFSMTAWLGSSLTPSPSPPPGATLLYSTGAPGTYSSQSTIQGSVGQSYNASEAQSDDSAGLNSRTSSLGLSGNPPQSVYNSSGLPDFSSLQNDTGSFSIEVNGVSGTVDFGIFGATPAPVPLPAAAWLLISGLGGLGALAHRRKAS